MTKSRRSTLHRSGEAVKTYLGDGVYAEFDGYGIKLTTENGVEVSNSIYVEPEVLRALVKFADAPPSTEGGEE